MYLFRKVISPCSSCTSGTPHHGWGVFFDQAKKTMLNVGKNDSYKLEHEKMQYSLNKGLHLDVNEVFERPRQSTDIRIFHQPSENSPTQQLPVPLGVSTQMSASGMIMIHCITNHDESGRWFQFSILMKSMIATTIKHRILPNILHHGFLPLSNLLDWHSPRFCI